MGIVIGLDTSKKSTGWCIIGETGKVIESGVKSFTPSRGESNGVVFLKFRAWMQQLIDYALRGSKTTQITAIGYEQAHHRGGASTEMCVGLTTRVQEIAAFNGIEYIAVHTGTLKKWAAGHGKASKEDMIRVASRLIGRAPVSDDEADAVAIAAYTYDQVVGLFPMESGMTTIENSRA